MDILQPAHWPRPKGYVNGIAATGRSIFCAGQIGWDENEAIVSDDFTAQAQQTLRNIVAILKEAGADPEHIVRLTWFVTDREEYRTSQEGLGRAYREVMGNHYPAMTLVVVGGLVEEGAKVEIEATAVLPG